MRPSLSVLTIGWVLGCALPLAAQDAPPAVGAPRVVGETAASSGLTCGQYQANWIGDAAETSDISTSDAPLQTALQTTGADAGAIAFRISDGTQSVRIEAQPDESGDPTIELISANGSSIAENDDFSDSLASRIETSLEPGDYCVVTRSVDDADLSTTLQVSLDSQQALISETGSTALESCTPDTQATQLTNGPLDQGVAGGELRVDAPGNTTSFYRFTLSQPASLTFKATSENLDPQMGLYSEDGTEIAQNDDSNDGTNSQLDFLTPMEPGNYCISVSALSPGDDQITLSAAKLDRETYMRSAYKSGQMPPPLDGSYPVEELDISKEKQRTVLNDGNANWLLFSIEKTTAVLIEAHASVAGGDPKLVVFDEFGRLQGENDDGENGLDSYLGPLVLEPGKYFIAVSDVERENSPGGTVRPIGLIFDRFERVQ